MEKTNEVRSLFLMLVVLLFAVSSPILGIASTEKVPYKIPKVTSKVKVDGILDEDIWQEALVLGLNYEVEPGYNIKPPVKTQVLMAYGSNHLYVAFRADDPDPSAIRARFTDRDKIWDDDYVGIVLNTFNDSRRSYNFYCNPHGIQADRVQVLKEEITGEEWDAIWNAAGRIHEGGYIVEMDIPFNVLRFQRKKGQYEQVWGIDAVRSYPRNLPHLIGLFPRDRNNNCYLCQTEKIIGFQGIKSGKNIELDPTVTTIYTQERDNYPGGKFVEKNRELEPGLTAQWKFNPNLTFSAAVNPDFSQVEADAAQLDINTQFALYYPEKRPFFLEGFSIFTTQIYTVYTRTIADPIWGVKLTGKEGRHAVGLFTAQDNITNLIFPDSEGSKSTSLDMNNLGSVLRYRLDVGKSSNLGVIFTNREGDDYFNKVISLDLDLRLTKRNRVIFQYVGSQTQYPDQISNQYNQPQGDFWGTAFDFFFYHTTEHVRLHAHVQQATSKFRADLGFVPQVDFRYINYGFGYIWRRPHGHWFTYLRIGAAYHLEKDLDDDLLYEIKRLYLAYTGPFQSYLTILYNIGKKGFKGIKFDNSNVDINAGIRPSGTLFLGFKGVIGEYVDFSNVRPATLVKLNPLIQYKIGRHFYMELDHVFERLKVDEGRLYTASLSNLRLIYHINCRTFLRGIFQYANFDYNSNLYTFPIDSKQNHLFTQILFSYKINPRTVLFLGYSDDHYGYQNIPLTQKNRTLFLKIGYALTI